MQTEQLKKQTYLCDCCGTPMYAHACKISCPNCGFRFDCSDLTLNFDPETNTMLPNFNHFDGNQFDPNK
ncbi:MAG: hypothetical protein DWQ07_03205 [Chloroflexi bacterium]|nr:MAG: hypothetical protein DWQ07_03205 [Chloroflexota bacterium]MBL1193492.1 hypothetical protein [Chloroflexota bacterium]